jgi:hypothetical protein
LQALQLPFHLDVHEAQEIAAAYATEICDVLQAEAIIADRRYRQVLLSARCYRYNALRMQGHCQKALAESNLLRMQNGMGPLTYPYAHASRDSQQDEPKESSLAPGNVISIYYQALK